MRSDIARQWDNKYAVSALFATIETNGSLTFAASACAYSGSLCFFFSDDDNTRTRARSPNTVTEPHCQHCSRCGYCWLLVLCWADDAVRLRPINWRRSRAKCAAERRVVALWRRGQLIAWSCSRVAVSVRLYCCYAFPVAFLSRDLFYFGLFQFPCLFQSSSETIFLVLPR